MEVAWWAWALTWTWVGVGLGSLAWRWLERSSGFGRGEPRPLIVGVWRASDGKRGVSLHYPGGCSLMTSPEQVDELVAALLEGVSDAWSGSSGSE